MSSTYPATKRSSHSGESTNPGSLIGHHNKQFCSGTHGIAPSRPIIQILVGPSQIPLNNLFAITSHLLSKEPLDVREHGPARLDSCPPRPCHQGCPDAKHGVEVAKALLLQVDGTHGPMRLPDVHGKNHLSFQRSAAQCRVQCRQAFCYQNGPVRCQWAWVK